MGCLCSGIDTRPTPLGGREGHEHTINKDLCKWYFSIMYIRSPHQLPVTLKSLADAGGAHVVAAAGLRQGRMNFLDRAGQDPNTPETGARNQED